MIGTGLDPSQALRLLRVHGCILVVGDKGGRAQPIEDVIRRADERERTSRDELADLGCIGGYVVTDDFTVVHERSGIVFCRGLR